MADTFAGHETQNVRNAELLLFVNILKKIKSLQKTRKIMKNSLSAAECLKRTREIDPEIRGHYFRDQTAIIHSMAFRRLKHKTQVFFSPENDHVCTRIEHVMHVATIAKSICKGLNLNNWELDEEAAFAIGLGHDLGHSPFGHEGEFILSQKLGITQAFMHELNSYRVVQALSVIAEIFNDAVTV